jgi:hypothetical protein
MNCTRLETLTAGGDDWQTNVDNWNGKKIVEGKETNNTRVTSPQETQYLVTKGGNAEGGQIGDRRCRRSLSE